MCRTEQVWGPILWFVCEFVGISAFVLAVAFPFTPNQRPTLCREAIQWFPVVTLAGTTGNRVLHLVDPKLVRQGLDAIPAKSLGHIVFNPSERMTVGREERIEAAITLGDVAAAIRQFVSKTRPTVAPLNGRVASRMGVKLFGDDFTIKERSSEEQQIDMNKPSFEPTFWRWDVTPLKVGRLVLTLRATRIRSIPKDGEAPRPSEL